MPIYEFACPDCGLFSARRPLAEAGLPDDCPACGAASRRVIASAPGLAQVSSARRTAIETNERSAHAPLTSRGGHAAGCGCGAPTKPAAAGSSLRSRSGSRPWMIGH